MEWSATTVVTSHVSTQRSPVPFGYVFKLNAPSVLRKESTRILETVNSTARSPTGAGYSEFDLKGTFAFPRARIIGALSFGPVSLGTDISPPRAPVTPQIHLSCAREVLDRKRRLEEKSQDKGDRMGRKRKIHAEGVEIRKSADRPTKRQCDEKTRNVGLLSDIEMELITCEIESRRLSQVPSLLTTHKRLLPLFQCPIEEDKCIRAIKDPKILQASTTYDHRKGYNQPTLKASSPSRKVTSRAFHHLHPADDPTEPTFRVLYSNLMRKLVRYFLAG